MAVAPVGIEMVRSCTERVTTRMSTNVAEKGRCCIWLRHDRGRSGGCTVCLRRC